MHMAKMPLILNDISLIKISAPVIMTDVKSQTKYRRLKKYI